MEYVEYECPNCGGQVDVQDEKVAFCAYCGTKLVKKTVATDHIKDYVRRSLNEIKVGRYEDCKRTVDEALRQHPDDSELNFIKAVVSQDQSYLNHVTEDEVSADVVEVCVDHLSDVKKAIKQTASINHALKDGVRRSVYKINNKEVVFEYPDVGQKEREDEKKEKDKELWLGVNQMFSGKTRHRESLQQKRKDDIRKNDVAVIISIYIVLILMILAFFAGAC